MSQKTPIKLIPRNAAALRRGQNASATARLVAGNPASTLLESGVGNCFPGLECDLRNLERRFFPFLEVDIQESGTMLAEIISVDTAGVQAAIAAGQLTAAMGAIYQTIAAELQQNLRWVVDQVTGTFGPLGNLTLSAQDLGTPSAGPNRRPTDPWTAFRLLTEGTLVQLVVRRGNLRRNLSGNRMRYLDDNGALARMFLPGELTQSLCSPWTHDFRDCGCYYWASNHPDIAKPPLAVAAPNVPAVNLDTPWERVDRTLTNPPVQASPNPAAELRHYEINAKWQTLNFVLEGRETVGPYSPGTLVGVPFANLAELEANLRYAAGVELAVMHEYLTAVFSLKLAGLAPALRDDVTAAHSEMLRVAIGEMRHLRSVNNVLASLGGAVPFVPALRVARELPAATPTGFRPAQSRPLRPAVIQEFIDIEQPSRSVDGLYIRILATLDRDGTDEQEQTIRAVMAEGEDHFETFQFIQEWLSPHDPNDYLQGANLVVPPPGNLLHQTLQQKYLQLLDLLFTGYSQGLPAGAANINAARSMMLGVNGIMGAAEAVAQAGFLVTFDALVDARFAPMNHP